MKFDQYQALVKSFDIVPPWQTKNYALTNLAGEVGELTSLQAKAFRDNPNSELTAEQRKNFEKELGDVLFMVAYTAYAYGLDLGAVAQQNIEKLTLRQARGTLQGSGDNR